MIYLKCSASSHRFPRKLNMVDNRGPTESNRFHFSSQSLNHIKIADKPMTVMTMRVITEQVVRWNDATERILMSDHSNMSFVPQKALKEIKENKTENTREKTDIFSSLH